MKNHTKYPALVTTILLTVGLFAAPAAQAETPQREVSAPEAIVAAPVTASLKFEKPSVVTTKAPVVYVAPEPVAVVTESTVAQPAQAVAKPTTPTTNLTAPVAKAEDTVSAVSNKGAAIAAAAYAQLGVSQDCTMLVTNSLRAVGINFHDWPAGYFSLGRTVSAAEAQPGDLTYYANGGSGMAHIAVYVGGGKAVHGGWNGGTTSLQSVNVGSGPVFIRVA